MKIKEFESEIDKLGLMKHEVRLGRGSQVHWFICSLPEQKNPGRRRLVIFDKNGHAHVLPDFEIPEDVAEIKIDKVLHEDGTEDVAVNGRATFREYSLDLPCVC